MNLKTLIIHQNKTLYNILEEIGKNINFNIKYIENIDLYFKDNEDHILITQNKILNIKKKLVINSLPIKINKLI